MNRTGKNALLLFSLPFLIFLLSACTFSGSVTPSVQNQEAGEKSGQTGETIGQNREVTGQEMGKNAERNRKQAGQNLEDAEQSPADTEQKPADAEQSPAEAGTSGLLPEDGQRILLIYMVGSDLESSYGSASADIAELLSFTEAAENRSIYLCTGGTEFWWRAEIPPDECTVFQAKNGMLTRCVSLPGANMADPETLTWFIDSVGAEPETAELSFIFWNHGGGATAGCGADANFDFDIMSVPEIRQGLESSAYIRNGGRFSLIGFDACLMGMLEVADSLKDCGEYMVASEETVSGCGWDYARIAELYLSGSAGGREAGKAIAEAYRNAVETESPYETEYTVSVLDLSETAAVTDALGRMMTVLGDGFSETLFSGISKIRRQTRGFGNKGSIYDSMDLKDFACRIRSLCPAEADRLTGALEQFIVLNLTNIEDACGVAVYFPCFSKEEAESRLQNYDALAFCPAYTAFIRDFQTVLNGERLADWNIENTVPVLTEQTLSMQLDESQTENFASASCMIWEDLRENGEYRCWYRGGAAELSPDGTLTAHPENRIFVIQDESDTAYAPCMALEMQRNGDTVTYKTVLSVIRIPEVPEADGGSFREETERLLQSAQWEFYTVEVLFRVDPAHPEGVITDLYVTNASKAGVPDFLPPKYEFTLQEGDIVQCFQLCRRITYAADGSVNPFSEWENTGTYRGYDFTASGQGIRIGTMELDPEADYIGLLQVTDLQQNTYMSDLVPLKPDEETAGSGQ